MSGARVTFLVARRELRERARGRAFRVSTAVMLLAVLALVAVPRLFADDGPTEATVVVAGADAAAAVQAARSGEDAFGLELRIDEVATAQAARRRVDEGGADVAVADGTLTVGADAPDALVALLQSAWRETQARATLERAGLEPAEIEAALAPDPLRTRHAADVDDDAQAFAFIATVLLFGSILTFGLAVSYGVVEEKSSRVIEVVLSAIRPLQLLCGKVIGIGLLGLAQIALVVAVGLAAAVATDQAELPTAAPALAAIVLCFFVLGYAFYACAFAVAGAIVSRQEDLQSTTAPMSIVLGIGYFVSIGVIDSPDSTVARVFTFLPPFAPMVVPVRAAQDAIPAWELALSIALTVAGIAVALVLAARIYRRAVLRLGSPLKLTQALRLAGR